MRTLPKLTAHCLLSVVVMQARAVAQVLDGKPIRECLRKVARSGFSSGSEVASIAVKLETPLGSPYAR